MNPPSHPPPMNPPSNPPPSLPPPPAKTEQEQYSHSPMSMKTTKKSRLTHNKKYHKTYFFCRHDKCG